MNLRELGDSSSAPTRDLLFDGNSRWRYTSKRIGYCVQFEQMIAWNLNLARHSSPSI